MNTIVGGVEDNEDNDDYDYDDYDSPNFSTTNTNTTTNTNITTTRPREVNPKLLIYMTFSVLTLSECILAGYLTLLSRALRERLSTWFSSCLILSIGILSSLSLSFALVLLSASDFTYVSRGGCWIRVVQRYLSTVSCFLLVCLSLDRYLYICWPLRYYTLLTVARCRNLCIACWVLPVALLLVPCLASKKVLCQTGHTDYTFLISYSVVYTLGTLATLCFYLLVAMEFRCSRVRRRGRPGREGTSAPPTPPECVREKTARSALRVLMLYTILSLPHTLLPLLALMETPLVPWWVKDAGHLVYRLHLLLFLPMYAFTSDAFLACLNAWGMFLLRKVTCSGFKSTARRGEVCQTLEVSFTQCSAAPSPNSVTNSQQQQQHETNGITKCMAKGITRYLRTSPDT
ncbi:hypothetical protein Pmani_012749 [Petrolisthes manimaculis]|uniref:G-protein coupled receptors family 1 profile domain-containing protein n=1 Tax=Petrolisthes manimaculis TaxID=1843537 RepID=A0AAE1PZT9_9EUCA|nr:hypothetical protein Pmani_012749 [Petrolisthes manimaculis]